MADGISDSRALDQSIGALGDRLLPNGGALSLLPNTPAAGTGRITLHHIVNFEGAAPKGVTPTGVASILNAGVDASGLARSIRLRAGVR